MKSKFIKFRSILTSAAVVLATCAISLVTRSYAAQDSGQKTFETPQLAADALVNAAEAYDVPFLIGILGPDSRDLVVSEDPVADRNRAAEFAGLAREKQTIDIDPKNPALAEVVVGNDEWPLPIPLVRHNGKWYFDSKSGREEILFRRVGENELYAIDICRGYVEAQQEYASEKHDGSEVNQYAQRIISSPGKHDGLAWQNSDGSWGGPVGDGVAKALSEGYPQSPQPYHGYYFKILKGQGPSARLGEMNYMVEGLMIGGFALAAAPAQYRITGVKTFIVSYDGIVYQKDLGPNTLEIFRNMDRYDPDKTWQITNDEP